MTTNQPQEFDPIAHLSAQDIEDSELSADAFDAVRGLEQVRRFFEGTPLEAQITDMIALCDTVAVFARQGAGELAGDKIPSLSERVQIHHEKG